MSPPRCLTPHPSATPSFPSSPPAPNRRSTRPLLASSTASFLSLLSLPTLPFPAPSRPAPPPPTPKRKAEGRKAARPGWMRVGRREPEMVGLWTIKETETEGEERRWSSGSGAREAVGLGFMDLPFNYLGSSISPSPSSSSSLPALELSVFEVSEDEETEAEEGVEGLFFAPEETREDCFEFGYALSGVKSPVDAKFPEDVPARPRPAPLNLSSSTKSTNLPLLSPIDLTTPTRPSTLAPSLFSSSSFSSSYTTISSPPPRTPPQAFALATPLNRGQLLPSSFDDKNNTDLMEEFRSFMWSAREDPSDFLPSYRTPKREREAISPRTKEFPGKAGGGLERLLREVGKEEEGRCLDSERAPRIFRRPNGVGEEQENRMRGMTRRREVKPSARTLAACQALQSAVSPPSPSASPSASPRPKRRHHRSPTTPPSPPTPVEGLQYRQMGDTTWQAGLRLQHSGALSGEEARLAVRLASVREARRVLGTGGRGLPERGGLPSAWRD